MSRTSEWTDDEALAPLEYRAAGWSMAECARGLSRAKTTVVDMLKGLRLEDAAHNADQDRARRKANRDVRGFPG